MSLTKQIEQANRKYQEKFKHSQFINHSAIQSFISSRITEAYKKGFIDGQLDCINNK